jgi:DNA-directed RNA polymerase I, II, and III subunit RPABC2
MSSDGGYDEGWENISKNEARTDRAFSDDYEPQEPEAYIDEEEPDTNLDAGAADDNEAVNRANGQSNGVNGVPGNQVVAVGETGAGRKGGVLGIREKKIPNDKRTTTPFMTKYERARVLGTRALQIR